MSIKSSAPTYADDSDISNQHNVMTSEKASTLPLPSSFQASLSTVPTHIYPEGGLRAWLVVFGSFCAFFASLGIANTLATFQEYISAHQLSSYTPDQIGWIFSLYAFMSFACGVYIGPLFDIYGPRWLIIPGSLCVILSMMLLGLCTEYWHFIMVFSILGGVGTSLLFTPSVAAVGHYFNRRRGFTTGIVTSGGAIGGIVFPLTLSHAIPTIGFACATRVLGFILILLCVLAVVLVRPNLPPAIKATSAHPSIEPLRQPIFAFTTLGTFLLEFALFIPLTYMTTYSTSLPHPLSTYTTSLLLPLLSTGSVFGRILPGLYSEYVGPFNLLLLCTLLCALSIFIIWLPFGPTVPGILVFVLIFGFASGSNISITPVCVGTLCPISDYGRYYATCYTICSFGCLTGVPIAGALIQACGGGYTGLIAFTGGCYMVAFVAFGVARVLGAGWTLSAKF